MRGLKWIIILASMIYSVGAAPKIFFKEDFESGLKPQWKPVKFSGETKYVVVRQGTNSFLEGKARSSATGLAVELDNITGADATISWRWRIDKIPPGASDDRKNTFDHSARLFVAFKTLIGPPRSINYVWANQVQVGKTFHHPSSGRSRFIVLQSGNGRAGEWMTERRDVAKDWKTLFGDDEPPPIVGIGFMTDSDGTGSIVTGSYDDIVLQSPAANK